MRNARALGTKSLTNTCTYGYTISQTTTDKEYKWKMSFE
jgi:hypothetical protein